MDYQLWFYILIIVLNFSTVSDDDAPMVLRVINGVFLLFWVFRILLYLIDGS
jgi:hypothetical protein